MKGKSKTKKSNKKSLGYINKMHSLMLVVYAGIVFLAMMLVSYFTVEKTNQVFVNKVVNLTSSLGMQMKLNLEGYMNRMETIATLAFAEELAYTYDATDPNNDEYESINTEKIITDKLFSLCIMDNFVDYGIVYGNNRTVGKLSNGTSTLFGGELYEKLSSKIVGTKSDSIWFTGYEGNYKRIYYVKRVHENAVLFISFYSAELNEVFDNPETLADMSIYLVNQDYNILYSKSGEEVGESLPEEILSRIENRYDASFMDNEYLVSVNKCNDWYVVCSIPTPLILEEINGLNKSVYLVAFIAAFIAMLVCDYLSRQLVKPVRGMVADLDEKAMSDRLTGLLNKLSFEEFAANSLANSLESEKRVLAIIDIDDFKQVNDTLGHASGDNLLKHMGVSLRKVFSDDDYLGRIGGDEFAVLINSVEKIKGDISEYVEDKCRSLMSEFAQNDIVSNETHKVSISIGITEFPKYGNDFKTLYTTGDKALYKAKNSGKNTYCFYDTSMEGEDA
jgi:diguanylate cyclase (GGDEF) domain